MCIPVAGQSNQIHQCLPTCPVCWIFLSGERKQSLVSGKTVELGRGKELWEAKEAGCKLAGYWMQVIAHSKHVDCYDAESRLSAYVKPDSRSEPHDLRSITLCIADTKGVRTPIGDGGIETVYNGNEITWGLWAVEEQVTAKHLSQRFASPEVDSPEAFQTARGWIEDCFKNHDECPKPSEESRLPTRVLDIFSSFDTGKVRLHVSNSHDVGKTYAALSYCWGSTRRGSTRQTLLTCSNLDAFAIAGIAIASLPQTLQDAILVARQLKIPYLWIDSLCIIQDSEHDKAIEIAAMPQIYKEAVVTISAASASDCGEGFLSTRQDIRGFRDLSLILPWSMNAEKHENMSIDEILESAKGTDDIDAVFVTMDETCGFGNKPFAREVISKRAWTLQEGWLSSRLLIYGKGPLGWQCLKEAKYFGGTKPNRKVEEFVPTENRKNFFTLGSTQGTKQLWSIEGDRDQENKQWWWRQTIGQYTSRAMTDPNDKLPALSGIAAEFKKLLGKDEEYLAGIWKSMLPAPSWSWASVYGDINIKTPIEMIAKTEVQIHHAKIQVAEPLAPMGKVLGGVLELSGPVKAMSWHEVQKRFVVVQDLEESPHMNWDYIIPDNGHLSPYFKNAARNDQYAKPGENPVVSVFPPLPAAHISPRVAGNEGTTSVDSASHSDKLLKRLSRKISKLRFQEEKESDYLFLEICRAPEPRGIILIDAGNGKVKRIAYFFMGRRETSPEELKDGNWSAGARNWDWNEGLEIHKVSII